MFRNHVIMVCLCVCLPALAGAQSVVDETQDEFDRLFGEQAREFDEVADEMEREWTEWARADSVAFEEFRRRVVGRWGDYSGSTRKDWVEYSPDLGSRTEVDFESGVVRVEVLVPADASAEDQTRALEEAAATLASHRGRTMDYSVLGESPQPILPEPVLADQLATQTSSPLDFAEEVVRSASVEEQPAPDVGGVSYLRLAVTTRLVPNHLRVRAERYFETVREHASRQELDARLVFAVIQTESFFNPKARSPVPAFGLMQLVPKSGGRDAWRAAYGEDRIPRPNELYDPVRNIELGCTYLALLQSAYLAGIEDDQSRLYCSISAYNTGAGNVSRAFTGRNRIRPAVEKINSMSSDEVLDTLRKGLPYEETRTYVQLVLERARYYDEWKN